jgi:hypothetical protein
MMVMMAMVNIEIYAGSSKQNENGLSYEISINYIRSALTKLEAHFKKKWN